MVQLVARSWSYHNLRTLCSGNVAREILRAIGASSKRLTASKTLPLGIELVDGRERCEILNDVTE
jgi:hypothetical protein